MSIKLLIKKHSYFFRITHVSGEVHLVDGLNRCKTGGAAPAGGCLANFHGHVNTAGIAAFSSIIRTQARAASAPLFLPSTAARTLACS